MARTETSIEIFQAERDEAIRDGERDYADTLTGIIERMQREADAPLVHRVYQRDDGIIEEIEDYFQGVYTELWPTVCGSWGQRSETSRRRDAVTCPDCIARS